MVYRALDLFCGAGGAAVGINEAGFEDITGVDIEDQLQYPFEFEMGDALEYLMEHGKDYDFIWASPPCQAYSTATAYLRSKGKEYPDLVAATRALLKETGKPYIIENVPGAPLRRPIELCGTQFGLKVFRHRLFESNIRLKDLGVCDHTGHKIKVKRSDDDAHFFTVAGHSLGTRQEWSDAMGIYHMKTKAQLAQAIPPAYSKYLCEQIIEHIKNK